MFGEFVENSKLYNQYEHTNSVCGAADETTKYNSFSLEYYVVRFNRMLASFIKQKQATPSNDGTYLTYQGFLIQNIEWYNYYA